MTSSLLVYFHIWAALVGIAAAAIFWLIRVRAAKKGGKVVEANKTQPGALLGAG